MFFALSKILSWLFTPINWIILCLVLSFFGRKSWRKPLRWATLIMLLFFTNPAITNLAIKLWEVPPVDFADMPDGADVGVVLTGVTNPLQEPKDRTHFSKGVDRLLHTIQLYHLGKVRNILITGGSGSLLHQEVSEAAGMARVALMAGVKQEHLYVEDQSRNTRENAVNSAVLIKENWPERKVVLITSAFHMRRSEACFAKVGLTPVLFSTDFYSTPWEFNPLALFIPYSGCIDVWSILIREWVGIISYKVAGYI